MNKENWEKLGYTFEKDKMGFFSYDIKTKQSTQPIRYRFVKKVEANKKLNETTDWFTSIEFISTDKKVHIITWYENNNEKLIYERHTFVSLSVEEIDVIKEQVEYMNKNYWEVKGKE